MEHGMLDARELAQMREVEKRLKERERMANTDLTVKVKLEDEELQEALRRLKTATMRAWMRAEVHAALEEEVSRLRRKFPPRMETKSGELPAWAKYEEGTAH